MRRLAGRVGILAVVLALSFVALTAQADSIVNGGFEAIVVPEGSFQTFNLGEMLMGWTVVGSPGNVAIVSGSYTQAGIVFPGEEGQWLDLTGDGSNRQTGIEQTVDTAPGTVYTLSYSVGNVVDPNGLFGTTSTIDVFIDGNFLLESTNSGGGTTQAWDRYSGSFVANGSSTTIRFLNGDPLFDNSNGLDDIRLTHASSLTLAEARFNQVPELSPSFLLTSGLLAFALLNAINGYAFRFNDQQSASLRLPLK